MTLKLYEAAEAYQQLLALMDEGEAQDFEVALEQLKDTILVKAAGIGKIILSLDRTVEAIATEVDRLEERRGNIEQKRSWLKSYLKVQMLKAGIEKIQADVTTISVRKSPPSVVVTDPTLIPAQFQRIIPERREPDKKAIMEAYKEMGVIPPGISIETGNTYLVVK